MACRHEKCSHQYIFLVFYSLAPLANIFHQIILIYVIHIHFKSHLTALKQNITLIACIYRRLFKLINYSNLLGTFTCRYKIM